MKICILFCVFFTTSHSLKLPNYITQCSKPDPKLSECLQKSMNDAWPTIAKGDNKYHLQSLNPMKISFLQVNVGNALQGNLSNVALHGLDKIEFKDVTWDFIKRRVEAKYMVPQIKLYADYEIRGRILGLPIEGNGDCDVSFENMDSKLFFDYNIVEKRGKQYIDIKHTEMSYTAKKAQFDVRNLFNGEVHLGEAMNEVLNENWSAVNKEINPYFANAVGEVYSQILQAFFIRVSQNDFFSNYA